MNNYHYDDEQHQYFINDEKVPSVSEILPKQDFYCSTEQLERAREDGIDNHALIKMYFDTGDDYNEKYIQIFKRFLAEHSELGEWILSESQLYSDTLKFAGRPDMIFENGIVDLKRNFGKDKHHALQIAGYEILTGKKYKIWYIIVIDVDSDKYHIKNVYDKYAVGFFKMLLRQYHEKQSFEAWYKN